MSPHIRLYEQSDNQRVLDICIAAFTPIHEGFEAALGPDIFHLKFHDWKQQYANIIGGISPMDATTKVYVAEDGGAVVGFVFAILDAERKTGEIGLNGVDPSKQHQGIARAMYEFALAEFKKWGAEIAYVGSGGDAAHAPARAAYEPLGFDRAILAVHYFKRI